MGEFCYRSYRSVPILLLLVLLLLPVPPLDQPTLFYSLNLNLNLNLNQLNRLRTRLDKEWSLRTVEPGLLSWTGGGMLRQVEVEAQSTRLVCDFEYCDTTVNTVT